MSNRRRRKKLKRRHNRKPLTDTGASVEANLEPGHRLPTKSEWAGPSGAIGTYIAQESERTLSAYRSQPNLVDEHANHEEDTARGGYAHRQLFELVQNSADALASSSGERIWVTLNTTHLYCADEGRAIDPDGVKALMFSHLSPKRGTGAIGRFGLGFKSVLGVTDTPEFFSRSGSFRFDRGASASMIGPIAPEAKRYPVLRLPEAIDPWPDVESDPVLRSLMSWAVNIVRLPLKHGASEALQQQIEEFPAPFLLFVGHVSRLILQSDIQCETRTVRLHPEGDQVVLDDGGDESRWVVVSKAHHLSESAREDGPSSDDATEVPIAWAAPVERPNDPGTFWAFFPTMTTSLLDGVLNAPWKTNEDRQNLLPGAYNEELISAAAQMVAEALPALSTPRDPSRHLDALPRRREQGDSSYSVLLRDRLHASLLYREVVPDQSSNLRKISEVRFAPRALTRDGHTASDALDRWAAYGRRPVDWAHHSVLTRNRLSTLRWLQPEPSTVGPGGVYSIVQDPLPRATVAEWLEALVEGSSNEEVATRASMAAVQTAALIPPLTRDSVPLGDVVLTEEGRWVPPTPDTVYLNGGHCYGSGPYVHHSLEEDTETLDALGELGVKAASAESVLRKVVDRMLGGKQGVPTNFTWPDGTWNVFWGLTHEIDLEVAAGIIQEYRDTWRSRLRVRTISGEWHSLYEALLPGSVVPGDGSRDGDIAIDVEFHESDLTLLKRLGASDAPHEGHELSPPMMSKFLARARSSFMAQDLPSKPRWDKLNFATCYTSGPLDVLESLSEEGKAAYTWQLLGLTTTYEPWTMRHDTRDIYPTMDIFSPAGEVVALYGRIQTDGGIRPFSDAFGEPPTDLAAYQKLCSHPQAEKIRATFGLPAEADMPLEPVGEDSPVPLLDIWPGLGEYLWDDQREFDLVRCDEFRSFDGSGAPLEVDCVIREGSVYVARKGDERSELRSVVRELGLSVSDERVAWILLGLTAEDVQEARTVVRACATDEERLLEAVGEAELRRHLPHGLLTILQGSGNPLSGIQVAQAAIATFHTGALREYRNALLHLDPPRQWAGRPRAVQFVKSLGFSEEWAGDAYARREPFVEVDGPYTLPDLHDYQRRIVERVRTLLHVSGAPGEQRGMISMPTGSGKTRVAVQAVVEAIREDGFNGGILWVADRDELCEQAVEAWRQVWASEGAQAARLRISRMWAGQPQPLPTGDMHVIVATIQTLSAKIGSQPESYEFLADFKLLIFDEAHRSVAPTFTSVMEELGLTRWRRREEPVLIGLTATPYRGHDERETARLVNRYGSNRLDAGAFASDDPEAVIQELQDMRVLAWAEHATIEGGEFSLSVDELRQSQQVPWLPRSVEHRIAGDTQRTERIIAAYEEYIDPDWPTLVFATSVEHSQTLAALLTQRGIKARSVSGNTETSVRRRIVEEFRGGEVRVLVNYGIFREGFDAPKTRAIVVARPVYSPNLYFQMIGRGLRGVKNGGNDRCLILNVRDNIENFQRKLAFSELDWLWV